MSNSKSSYENRIVENALDMLNSEFPNLVLQAKIAYQIKRYTMTYLSAEYEIKDLQKAIDLEKNDYNMVRTCQERIGILKDEIVFCRGQIKAYAENDNKAKIIPDRCL